VDLASASQELYAGSPDDFVERRKQLVARARAAKDRPLATAIGQLRRPTRSAWLVNLYAREAAEELGALLDLGAALQTAQQELSGPDLRRLSADRGKALAAATRRAVEIGREHDYDAPEAARTEVTQTLQAALAEPEIAAQVRAGTLSQAQSYGGFGFALAPAVAPAPADESPTPASGGAAPDADAEAGAPEPDDEEAAERRRAAQQADEQRRARERAEQQVADAEAELTAATEAARVATERADELAEQVERLRTELATAEEAETVARQEARAARRDVSEREASVQDTRAVLDAL
jgi:hypothetical protein